MMLIFKNQHYKILDFSGGQFSNYNSSFRKYQNLSASFVNYRNKNVVFLVSYPIIKKFA